MGSQVANPNGLDSSDQYPTLGTFVGGWASAVRGAASRLRMSLTIHPTVLPHMIVSSRQLHADLLLSMEAERQGSANGLGRFAYFSWHPAPPRFMSPPPRPYDLPSAQIRKTDDLDNPCAKINTFWHKRLQCKSCQRRA
jgi:hypothetical protein